MAKIHKIQLYVIDANDNYDIEDVKIIFENKFDLNIHEVARETEEFEWNDDLNINNWNATDEDYEEYFKKEPYTVFCQDECGSDLHFRGHLCCRYCSYNSTCKDRCDMCDELDLNKKCDMEQD